MLAGITEGDESDIEKIDKDLILMVTPKVYGGNEGEEVRRLKVFTDNCLLIEQALNVNARTLTTREFLQASDIVRKQKK